ncbi:MAG: aldo/keto reductase [Alphaproteobacteria bacterium]|nr:aldo/keto reductase [Alphaproteobacteria bacterium]
MRKVLLPQGQSVPALGQGTWRMGEKSSRRAAEIAALRTGIDLGMTLIDTAEMYGEGATETFLGAALDGIRDRVFLVSKVYPQNAGGRKLINAWKASLKRLHTDRLDLYLLHWMGDIPLAKTVAGMEALQAAGKIRSWGVSNLDLADMRDLENAGGKACATDQILYNVTRRGPEFDLLPALASKGISAMAYSPVEQGRLPSDSALQAIADRHGATPYQVALAWVMREKHVIAIPKAANEKHVRENRDAADLTLTAEDLAAIDAAFPQPSRKTHLQML